MCADVSKSANAPQAFCRAFFDELARAGVREVCVCPGSRSAPLASAAIEHEALRCWSHVDERSAGFFALGMAKTSRTPVALLCTSGSAAVNFHPAVVEAFYARVPLLVLTADRPPELREWGAGQTIDQLRLFGPHVRWFSEVALPGATGSMLRYARSLACRAVDTAAAAPAGPVHLNFPLREPLEPRAIPGDIPGDLAAQDPLAAHGRDGRCYVEIASGIRVPRPTEIAALARVMSNCERGVIACGPLDATPNVARNIAGLAEALCWPLIAEPTSQLRRGPHVPKTPVIACADLLLRDATFAADHTPDFVLQLGSTPTSRSYRQWIGGTPPKELVLVDPEARWSDPEHIASTVLRVDEEALCAALLGAVETRSTSPWLEEFSEADHIAASAVERQLSADEELLEARSVREIAAVLPEDACLYVSSSMPIRDLDTFLPASPNGFRVLCNRGANGIDGMLSSALGSAAVHQGPNVLLTGDLALLHDCGALVSARRHGLSLTVVVIDNDGGGIFSFLPIADFGEESGFETYFRTPHGIDLETLCRGMGSEFSRVTSWEHLRSTLTRSLDTLGVSVISIPVDRDRNVAQHREIERAVSTALAASREAPTS